MDRLQQFAIFVEVAKRESFSEAALRLDLPRSTVTSAIQSLETYYKVRLFQRTTRRVSLTQDGKRVLPDCQNLLMDYQLLEQMIQTHNQDYQGILKVDMPSRISHQIVVPALHDFFRQYPNIQIQLHSSDHLTNLVEQEVDCVVRVGTLENSSLIAKSIGRLEMVNCASPDYLQHFGIPHGLEDLPQHYMVNYPNGVGEQQGIFFYGQERIKLNARLSVNNTEAYIQAARSGLGMIQIPYYDVREDLAKGSLIEILDSYKCSALPLNMLYPNRQYIPRRLDVFMSWLIPLLQQHCCLAR
ncbi:LysR family transcriptional regulator [Acinetobacter sp. S40]|uniref:LysR family transcriptional regulator n=1 Tax=unclassified Acinetobacter TaxID=196816 RepID=UPI00190AC5E8|nr:MULTISPECIES: LysR family transcriptional regulator [unclassified Acinetobacter]MBJ9984202.1 LysR family transcriptional regulator [Acinetobacter sp. S40]MBK0062749.1 LysR family transcriptional regulator [Acinetobacter sp. S55]MBK0065674.1 LysR family transcriptional regulator [Acinetobacter sp. S54]